jgi:hypothetical protein
MVQTNDKKLASSLIALNDFIVNKNNLHGLSDSVESSDDIQNNSENE